MGVWVARELQVTTQGHFMALNEHFQPTWEGFYGKGSMQRSVAALGAELCLLLVSGAFYRDSHLVQPLTCAAPPQLNCPSLDLKVQQRVGIYLIPGFSG